MSLRSSERDRVEPDWPKQVWPQQGRATQDLETPVLQVSDYAGARLFYAGTLGFEVLREVAVPEGETGFGVLRFGGAQIYLHRRDQTGDDDIGAGENDGWRGYFHADDLGALMARLDAKGYAYKGPDVTFYRMREIEVTDPDGNVLCFGTDAGTGV